MTRPRSRRSRRPASASRCRPTRGLLEGTGALGTLLRRAFGPDRDGDWLLLPAGSEPDASRRGCLRRPGDSLARPFKLDVLRAENGVIAEITTFGSALFPALGLPPHLTRRRRGG